MFYNYKKKNNAGSILFERFTIGILQSVHIILTDELFTTLKIR